MKFDIFESEDSIKTNHQISGCTNISQSDERLNSDEKSRKHLINYKNHKYLNILL